MRQPELHLFTLRLHIRQHMWGVQWQRESELHLFALHLRTRLPLRQLTRRPVSRRRVSRPGPTSGVQQAGFNKRRSSSALSLNFRRLFAAARTARSASGSITMTTKYAPPNAAILASV